MWSLISKFVNGISMFLPHKLVTSEQKLVLKYNACVEPNHIPVTSAAHCDTLLCVDDGNSGENFDSSVHH
jgi:hypothetical protein